MDLGTSSRKATLPAFPFISFFLFFLLCLRLAWKTDNGTKYSRVEVTNTNSLDVSFVPTPYKPCESRKNDQTILHLSFLTLKMRTMVIMISISFSFGEDQIR